MVVTGVKSAMMVLRGCIWISGRECLSQVRNEMELLTVVDTVLVCVKDILIGVAQCKVVCDWWFLRGLAAMV